MIRTLPQPVLNAGFSSWNALAERVGVDRAWLCHIRKGRQPLSPALRARIASALNIPATSVEVVIGEVSR